MGLSPLWPFTDPAVLLKNHLEVLPICCHLDPLPLPPKAWHLNSAVLRTADKSPL